MSELDFLRLHLGKSSSRIIIDVGCHKAEFSKDFLAQGFRVIGLEPNAADLELKECLDKFPDLELYAIAASDIDGQADMFIGEHVATNSLESRWVGTAFPDNFVRRNEKIIVPAEKLSTFLKRLNISDVALLKIDTEGHDIKVLKGLFEGVVRPEILMFEIHRKFPNDLLEAFDILKQNGYTFFEIFLHKEDGSEEAYRSSGTSIPSWWGEHKEFFTNVVALK